MMSRRNLRFDALCCELSPAADDDDLVRFTPYPLADRWNVTGDEGERYVTAGTIDDAIEFLRDRIGEVVDRFVANPPNG